MGTPVELNMITAAHNYSSLARLADNTIEREKFLQDTLEFKKINK